MKVLVVEDDHRIASLIKKGLELKAMSVDLSFDGLSGLDIALSESYDVIIIDRMLPQLDGIQLIKTLRKENNHTPILMLTAKTQVQDRVEGLEAGADDYLGKPFAFAELLARLYALARRPQKVESKILACADLTLNPFTLEVVRSGKTISLSKKEFTLLEYLLRHQGQIFSAQELVQNVWPYDSDVLANTAQVYISYLKKKIDASFPQKPKLIHTLRGFGYKLEG